ncbi:SRPBCC family protein [Methanobacterium oryzae]|uniref:SRPBCC family protein n=1 Tax=Methanobacterium oryzae TaxID=69540 RepID=UPI003D1CB5CF
MQKLNHAIVINAPKEKVWHTMLDLDTYKIWTEAFAPGSSYEGDWSEGSKMLFIGPDENGNMGGMVSQIKESRPYEFVSIEYKGVVKDGKEIITGEEAKEFAGSLENYTFKEMDGKTEVIVDLLGSEGIDEELKQYFQDSWKKALQKLKELAEKT